MTPKTQSARCAKCELPPEHKDHTSKKSIMYHPFEPVAEPASTGKPKMSERKPNTMYCDKCNKEMPNLALGPCSCGSSTFSGTMVAEAARPSGPSAPPCQHMHRRYIAGNTYCDDCKVWLHAGSVEPAPSPKEVAEQSAEPRGITDTYEEGDENPNDIRFTYPAAPQPVAGEGPQEWRKLPAGYWFFLDSPVCTNRYSVQERTDSGCTLVCSTPWHHDGAKIDMQRIADLHNSQAKGTPKLEEIAWELSDRMHKIWTEYRGEYSLSYEHVLAILRSFISAGTDFSGGNPMEYQVVADKLTCGDWRVEAINHAGEGECFVTIFSGPDSEIRAKEYASWKSQ